MSKDLLLTILALICISLTFLYYKLHYWQAKGVKTLKLNGLLGNLKHLTSMHHMQILQKVYDRYKTTEKLAGFYLYTKPVAVILDLDLIQSILLKDFNKFSDRFSYKNNKDLLAANILFCEGAIWKPMRNKFASIFTPAKIKYMFNTINATALQLKDTVEGLLKSEDVLNISDLSSRFTSDNISSLILGLEGNSLKFSQTEFHEISRQVTAASGFNVRWKLFMETYVHLIQATGLTVRIFPKIVEDFFRDLLKYNFLEREKLNIRRNDLTDLLIDLRKVKDAKGNPTISDEQIASNLFIFFAGGNETSSNAICFGLMELAKQPELQDKARTQILSVLEEFNNELSYEASQKMTYLDQIIHGEIFLCDLQKINNIIYL